MREKSTNRDLAGRIKACSIRKGIDLIGFSELDQDTFFLRPENRVFLQEQGYRWAISIADRISPSACDLLLRRDDAGLLFYFDKHCRDRAAALERAGHELCLFIESLGYRAFQVPGLGEGYSDGKAKVIVSHLTHARLSGLGEMGDSGMIITPEYGPRVRLATILTSCPLPAPERLPERICLHCGLCHRICPSGSIGENGRFDSQHPERYYTDKALCTRHRDDQKEKLGSRFCNLCMAVCPVGKPVVKPRVIRYNGAEHLENAT